MSIDRCKILDLPKIHDPRGNLTFIEGQSHVPFDIQRVYYLYDRLVSRYKRFFADVVLDDGKDKKRVHLNRSYNGLYVCPMIWRELDNFSSGAVCLVLASTRYDEADYYRDYAEFMRARWSAA